MATNNKSFRVRHGLDVNSNATVDTSGNANITGNLTANTGFISADTFRLDTTYTTGPSQPGEITWDADNETAQIQLDAHTIVQIGQELVIRVKNSDAVNAIPIRTAVMFAGAAGDTVTVAPANSANVSVTPSDYLVGITAEEIPADGFGFVTEFGVLPNVNTAAFTLGNLLYVDPANPGQFVTTRPTAPAWQTPVAAVTKVASGSGGRILVRSAAGVPINRVEGVEITSPATNDILRINANGIVVNSSLAVANIANLAATGLQTFSGNIAGTNFAATGNVNAVTVNATTFTGTAAFATTANAVAVGNVTGLGTNVATFLATPNSLNLLNTVTDETGTGSVVFATSPTLTTPNIGAATGTSINVAGQLISTQATGTAPLAVSSTTKVTNLNADLLDDLNSATANTASTIVARDSGGNIAANTATFVNVTATNGGNLNDGYRLKETLYITSTASFLKASYPYLRAIKVKVVGGGGGGGGTPTTNATSTAIGGSGSGAGYSEFLITDIAGLSATMWSKVGAAGTGGSAGSNAGNDGGASWFGTSNTTTTTTYGHAYGGTGGTSGTAATGNRAIAGVAGAAAGLTGDLKVGGGGSGSIFNAQSNFVHSAIGGSSGLGYSGGAYGEASTTSSVGANAGGYGGGGSGAVAGTGTGTARAGGDGSPGIVILELYA